jgi:hypothetical protein
VLEEEDHHPPPPPPHHKLGVKILLSFFVVHDEIFVFKLLFLTSILYNEKLTLRNK